MGNELVQEVIGAILVILGSISNMYSLTLFPKHGILFIIPYIITVLMVAVGVIVIVYSLEGYGLNKYQQQGKGEKDGTNN